MTRPAFLLLLSAILPGTTMLLGAAAPQGALSRGAEIVQHGTASGVLPCMACHGSRLQGNASIGAPALAGIPESATLAALAAVAAGKIGDNPVMMSVARSLTKAESMAVAGYLASLTKQKSAVTVGAPSGRLLTSAEIVQLSTGAQIVQHGTRSGAAPCATCHGSRLEGNASIGAPALAGMPAEATRAALDAIAGGKMGSNAAMRSTARALSERQRKAVAAFLALIVPAPRHPEPGTEKATSSGGGS